MRMSSAVLCFLATLTLASAGRLISPSDLELPALSDAPDFCHGLECPPFKLLKNTSKYQLREYEGAKFVGTTIEGSNFESAITQAFTGEAPAPKDDEINIVTAPGVTVYVKVFGGFGTGGTVLKEAATLRQDLTQDKISFKDGAFAYATYDGPQKLINRHNEVWITAADSDNSSWMAGPSMTASTIDAIQSALAAAQKAVAEMFHN